MTTCEPVVLLMPSETVDQLDVLREARWGAVPSESKEAVRAMCEANSWPLDSFLSGMVVTGLVRSAVE